jgi:hypothetical protein
MKCFLLIMIKSLGVKAYLFGWLRAIGYFSCSNAGLRVMITNINQ